MAGSAPIGAAAPRLPKDPSVCVAGGGSEWYTVRGRGTDSEAPAAIVCRPRERATAYSTFRKEQPVISDRPGSGEDTTE